MPTGLIAQASKTGKGCRDPVPGLLTMGLCFLHHLQPGPPSRLEGTMFLHPTKPLASAN